MQNHGRMLVSVGTCLCLVAPSVGAATFRSGETVFVPASETIDNDLYVVGENIEIAGTVLGDVFAFGRNVTVSGVVSGDLMGGGGRTIVSGAVHGGIRRCGSEIVLTGDVGDDLLGAGATVRLGPESRVGRDVLLVALSATLQGRVEGDVNASVRELTIGDGSSIGGELSYDDAEPSADAGGFLVALLRDLVPTIGLGLLFVTFLPRFRGLTADAMRAAPWSSVGLGALLSVVIPVTVAILLMIGVLIGGWWLALAGFPLYGVALVLGIVATALFVGERLGSRIPWVEHHGFFQLMLGLTLLILLTRMPFLGNVVLVASVVFGLGGLALAAYRASNDTLALTEAS